MTEKQILPTIPAVIKNTNNSLSSLINDKNRKKLKLLSLETDNMRYITNRYTSPSTLITVREDIINKIISIKKIVNNLQVNFLCQNLYININNEDISDLARVGLQFNLNSLAGMHINSHYSVDEYFIGPDYSNPFKNGYRMKIYGLCRRIPILNNTKYKVINEEIDIYDVKDTYISSPPKIKKIFKPVIDLSKIISDNGFIQAQPDPLFFENSDYTKSYWNVFYYANNLKIGYTYNELLNTVYDNNNEKIWLNNDKVWNGSDFVWR